MQLRMITDPGSAPPSPTAFSNEATCHLSILHLPFMLHTFRDDSHFKNIIS